jgi:hypothetical protein
MRVWRFWRIGVAAVAAFAAATATWAGGAAYGLWTRQGTVAGFSATTGTVGFAVTTLLPAGTVPIAHTAAASDQDTLTVGLGPTEAGEILAAPGMAAAWSFDVVMSASGNAGIGYQVDIPQFASGTIFGSSTVSVFRVEDREDCSPSAAEDSSPTNGQIPGISPGYQVLKQKTDHWCVVAEADAAEMAQGHYVNTAEVTAIGPENTQVSDQDVWEADLLLDPAFEPTDIGLAVTHEVLGPQ